MVTSTGETRTPRRYETEPKTEVQRECQCFLDDTEDYRVDVMSILLPSFPPFPYYTDRRLGLGLGKNSLKGSSERVVRDGSEVMDFGLVNQSRYPFPFDSSRKVDPCNDESCFSPDTLSHLSLLTYNPSVGRQRPC